MAHTVVGKLLMIEVRPGLDIVHGAGHVFVVLDFEVALAAGVFLFTGWNVTLVGSLVDRKHQRPPALDDETYIRQFRIAAVPWNKHTGVRKQYDRLIRRGSVCRQEQIGCNPLLSVSGVKRDRLLAPALAGVFRALDRSVQRLVIVFIETLVGGKNGVG